MSQEIEIEFKTMLTKEEFELLRNRLPFPEQPIVQINHYFETELFALKDYRSALRIREKNNHFTLTLKEPHHEGILETHDSLSEFDANQWLKGHPTTPNHVMSRLDALSINVTDLRYYGSLQTKRFTYQDGKIDYMLDESQYHDMIDYELEIEAPSKDEGLQALRTLLQEQTLKYREAQPKIARFFKAAF